MAPLFGYYGPYLRGSLSSFRDQGSGTIGKYSYMPYKKRIYKRRTKA